MPSKYDPLTERLKQEFANADIHEVTLTFEEIGTLVGRLPGSASKAAWWANAKSDSPLPHVQAWSAAGCFVYAAAPKKAVATVTFHRGESNHGNGFADVKPGEAIAHAPLNLSWSWSELGNISRHSMSKHPSAKLELRFPLPPEGGGIYRYHYTLNAVPHSYVGKTRDFRTRLIQYRSATGETEVHVETALHAALDQGNTPTVFVATAATGTLTGAEPWALDMTDDLDLVLLEHAAISCERQAGRKVINRIRGPRT